ncbi:hypothetical protein [Leptospira meyeri]|uniref:hypothetical protein n=1 Tax=Leptospira meyeri TaxID=29508 RepID=UPI000F64F0C9|nr:hypothetical protein [Leptospira meyeri]
MFLSGIVSGMKLSKNKKISFSEEYDFIVASAYIDGYVDGTTLEFEFNVNKAKRFRYCIPSEGVRILSIVQSIYKNIELYKNNNEHPRLMIFLALTEEYPCGSE